MKNYVKFFQCFIIKEYYVYKPQDQNIIGSKVIYKSFEYKLRIKVYSINI